MHKYYKTITACWKNNKTTPTFLTVSLTKSSHTNKQTTYKSKDHQTKTRSRNSRELMAGVATPQPRSVPPWVQSNEAERESYWLTRGLMSKSVRPPWEATSEPFLSHALRIFYFIFSKAKITLICSIEKRQCRLQREGAVLFVLKMYPLLNNEYPWKGPERLHVWKRQRWDLDAECKLPSLKTSGSSRHSQLNRDFHCYNHFNCHN